MFKYYSLLSPCPAHGLTCEMELTMLIDIFCSSFLCIYVFTYILCFLSRTMFEPLCTWGMFQEDEKSVGMKDEVCDNPNAFRCVSVG